MEATDKQRYTVSEQTGNYIDCLEKFNELRNGLINAMNFEYENATDDDDREFIGDRMDDTMKVLSSVGKLISAHITNSIREHAVTTGKIGEI